jgi:hypothetical protein
MGDRLVHLSCGAERRRHAHVAPRAPVDRDGGHSIDRALALRECIEERVGRRVVDLPGDTGDCSARREHHEEVEYNVPQRGVECERALDLRRQDARDRSSLLGRDQSVIEHAGRVHDAVNATESRDRRLHDGFHLRAARDVSRRNHHLRAQRLELPHARDRAARAIARSVSYKPPIPLGAIGQR